MGCWRLQQACQTGALLHFGKRGPAWHIGTMSEDPFFVKHRCASTRCLFLTKRCVIISAHTFSSSRAACFTLSCEMLASVAHSSSFRSYNHCFLRIFFSCCETGLFGLSVVFWFLFALTLTFINFIYSYGVPVWSKVFSRKEASSDMVLICQAGQRFQTCRPTEKLSCCSGEGSPKHT